jgi:hypothetical protein
MTTIKLDYCTTSRNEPRYALGRPHLGIQRILDERRSSYHAILKSFRSYFVPLSEIDATSQADTTAPAYVNDYLPGLDCVALYCLLAQNTSASYIEIGSGNSTKFARRSIHDNRLKTTVVSIDPQPRANVETIADEIIRKPLEDVDLSIFDRLRARDVLFIDNSHRSFMNSDVTVCFLDVLPRLASGVLIQIHDIFLPYDYPPSWAERYYNEQYLLGALLANGMPGFDVVLPCYYVSLQQDLVSIVEELWQTRNEFRDVERHGGSFWMRKR